MALLEILTYPDERLRTIAQPQKEFNLELEQIVNNMFETMYHANGIGLAATQVNIHHQIIVMDISEERNTPKVFINPKIIEKKGKFKNEEGCLSVPDISAKVERAEEITFEAYDVQGNLFTNKITGLDAICLQHEIDHLNGILFVDYLSPSQLSRLKKKLLTKNK